MMEHCLIIFNWLEGNQLILFVRGQIETSAYIRIESRKTWVLQQYNDTIRRIGGYFEVIESEADFTGS